MGRRNRRSYFVPVEDDRLLTNDIGSWADDKYRHMGMYAQLFSTGMKNRWDARVYLDLFAGPGYGRLRSTQQCYLGSPLIALSLPDPFNCYILAEERGEALEALQARVARHAPDANVRFVSGDANQVVDEVTAHIPDLGRVLSFCFLDPFKLNIHFETVRRLAAGRNIDFLILQALYHDANRNVAVYTRDDDPTIDRYLGDNGWRARWTEAARANQSVVRFLAEEYSMRMAELGYLPMSIEDMVKVRTHDKRLPLYYLAFYSKHPKGLEFWSQVRRYTSDQIELI